MQANQKSPKLALLALPTNGGWLLVLILALLLFERPLGLLWDGGACKHITTAMYIWQHHYVPTVNYNWAINPHYHWTTIELLPEFFIAVFYGLAGLNGFVLLFSLVIGLSLLWAFQIARTRGLTLLPAFLSILVLIYTCAIHWSARPHLFTYLAFVAMFFFVFCWQGDAKKRAIGIGLSILFWANSHGSFMLGIGMLIIKLIADLLAWHKVSGDQDEPWPLVRGVDRFKVNALTLLLGVVACCFNYNGPGFLTYVLGYMSNPVIRNVSDEWRALDFTVGLPTWTFLAYSCCLFAAWVFSPRKPRLAEFTFVLALFVFSLYGMRIIPYFMLAALMTMAPSWAAWSAEAATASGANPILRNVLAYDSRLSNAEPAASLRLAAGWGAAAIVLCAAWMLMPQYRLVDFDPAKLPVETTNYIREHKLDGLGFNWDNWGAYISWKLDRLVYVDDGTDWYPPEFINEYAQIYFMKPGWEEAFARRNFQWVLIPPWDPMKLVLDKDAHWKLVARDQASLLYVRSDKQ